MFECGLPSGMPVFHDAKYFSGRSAYCNQDVTRRSLWLSSGILKASCSPILVRSTPNKAVKVGMSDAVCYFGKIA